jgi:hypothetical protein
MLKFFFWILLFANGVVFAYHQSYLEELIPSGREPERMARQMNADKIRPVATPPAARPEPAETDTSALPVKETAAAVADKVDPPAASACVEIGNFTGAEAKRFEAQLASFFPSMKSTRVERAETSSHMVMIPSQGDKEGAAKKASELRALGITDYFILQENANPDLRWGISLGVFRNEEAARAYLVQLAQKGVRSARLADYKMPMKKFAFQLQGTDQQLKTGMDKIKQAFPGQPTNACQ